MCGLQFQTFISKFFIIFDFDMFCISHLESQHGGEGGMEIKCNSLINLMESQLCERSCCIDSLVVKLYTVVTLKMFPFIFLYANQLFAHVGII